MKIFGIGTDIVNIKRIDNILKRNGSGFKKKFFSKNEIIYCEKKKEPSSYYAKRFAAKEAVTKAMGIGIAKGINLKNIEVINDRNGKPDILLKGKVDAILKKKINKKKYNIYLSLSDDKPWAHATVVISHK